MAIWLALVVYLVALAGGLAYAVLRGLALWRRLKRTGGAFSAASARIARSLAGVQTHLARANGSVARLGENGRRITLSRARLGVRLRALREARETMRRLLWFVPGA